MLGLDLDQVRKNAQNGDSEDLLDRVTVYREGMEPAALAIIEEELAQRGVTPEMIERHAQKRSEAIRHPDGIAAICSYCRNPAIGSGWRWHRVWNRIPLFPRRAAWCGSHAPRIS